MEIASLKTEPRDSGGTAAARRLRSDGRLPAIVYGDGGESIGVSIDTLDFATLLRHHERVVELDLDGQQQRALIQDIQYDSLGSDVVHVDFLRVREGQLIGVTVEIEFVGHPKGLAQGGEFVKSVSDLPILARATAIPASIPVRIDDLEVGGSIYIDDVEMPEGVECELAEGSIICSLKALAEEVEEEEATEEGAEPEVIAKGKADEEGGDEPSEE